MLMMLALNLLIFNYCFFRRCSDFFSCCYVLFCGCSGSNCRVSLKQIRISQFQYLEEDPPLVQDKKAYIVPQNTTNRQLRAEILQVYILCGSAGKVVRSIIIFVDLEIFII